MWDIICMALELRALSYLRCLATRELPYTGVALTDKPPDYSVVTGCVAVYPHFLPLDTVLMYSTIMYYFKDCFSCADTVFFILWWFLGHQPISCVRSLDVDTWNNFSLSHCRCLCWYTSVWLVLLFVYIFSCNIHDCLNQHKSKIMKFRYLK